MIIDKNISKKQTALECQHKLWLSDFEAEYKKSEKNLQSLLSSINLLINKIEVTSIKLDAHIWKVNILIRMLKDTANINVSSKNEIKKKLFLTIRKSICLSSDFKMKSNQREILSEGLELINCSEIARRNGLYVAMEQKDTNSDSWIRYQLKFLGPELERVVQGRKDPRADGFIPDDWQCELFDVVDKRQSAVIVAPTSSGKTYASYYCMESVLREGTEGIVVYVAPTKALVNQVAATVYARFKNTVMPAGQSVYGIFTRDFRTFATNCQILVTVPQCLELLLMSPRQYQWVKKLRYVIFDEVHCIVGNIGSIYWERCLLLIQCPFLALSATIRHPQQLHEWLQEAEEYKQNRNIINGVSRPKESYRVHLVIHTERHSDLTKYTYSNQKFYHLHPYANLEENVMKIHNGIPGHMLLSPAETLELYDAMYSANPSSTDFQKLAPEIFFAKHAITGFISRNIVRDYEIKLSHLLTNWFKESNDHFCSTIELLKPGNKGDIVLGRDDRKYVIKNIVQLILNLKEQNMFPVLIFSYDRILIENMMNVVTEYLKKNDILIERRVEKKLNREEKLKKKLLERTAAKESIENKAVTYKPRFSILQSSANSLKEIGCGDTNDVKFVEKRLQNIVHPNSMFVQALQHGLCLHHSGMNNKMRSAVEMLFRMKFLNIVFATGTLALGIHMPCKTTVIAANSPYLNSLEYHQMSGRAGRRGYDTAGNVIFFGLNQRKQHTLLTAHLPSIKGVFPLNVTMILRLLLLVADVTDKGKSSEEVTKITLSRVMTLLENSMAFKHNPRMKDQIKHFFCITLQFLIMQEYINEVGVPLKWCGLATHLHYHEPGNLALIYLLRIGEIRKLCTEGKNDDEIQYQLINIVSHLFTKLPLRADFFGSNKQYDNSKVILDPLPGSIRKVLETYNSEVNFVFSQYFKNIATHCSVPDIKLPLSKAKFSSIKTINIEDLEHPECLYRNFVDLCVPKLICSHFAALSGNNDDDIYSKNKVISNIKTDICVDSKIVPIINLDIELNGYALDFYRHGLIAAIRKDNGLRAGEEFTLIRDFMLILKTILVSLEEMKIIDPERDPVYRHFKIAAKKYSALFNTAFPNYNY